VFIHLLLAKLVVFHLLIIFALSVFMSMFVSFMFLLMASWTIALC